MGAAAVGGGVWRPQTTGSGRNLQHASLSAANPTRCRFRPEPVQTSPLARGSFVLVIVLLLVLDRSDYERDCEQEHEGSFSRAAGRNIHPRCPNFLPLTEGLAPPWPFSSTFSKRMNSTYESARIRNFVGFLRTAKLVRFHLSFGRGSVSCSFL